jgi:CHASE3 domain sensor protein
LPEGGRREVQNSDEKAARLERINRNLTIAVIALAIAVILLVIIDFAP